MLDREMIAKLDAPFDEGRVKTKKVPGRSDASYLESYDVINKANEVFGYGGWGITIKSVEGIPNEKRVQVRAIVTLHVGDCPPVDGFGVNTSMNLKPDSIETAYKGAVSDAEKRALRHFGKQFGNDLYDKERDGGNGPKRQPEKKALKARGGRLSSDATTVLWSYAREKEFDEEYVRGLLDENDGDPTKVLVILSEQTH